MVSSCSQFVKIKKRLVRKYYYNLANNMDSPPEKLSFQDPFTLFLCQIMKSPIKRQRPCFIYVSIRILESQHFRWWFIIWIPSYIVYAPDIFRTKIVTILRENTYFFVLSFKMTFWLAGQLTSSIMPKQYNSMINVLFSYWINLVDGTVSLK